MNKYAYAGIGALALLAAIALVSCGQQQAVPYQPVAVAPAPAPVVVQQAPAQVIAAPSTVVVTQPSHDGFFTGMLMGHMLSGGSGYHAAPQTTIVNKTVINKPAPVAAAAAAPTPPAPKPAAPSVIPRPAPAPAPTFARPTNTGYSTVRQSFSSVGRKR